MSASTRAIGTSITGIALAVGWLSTAAFAQICATEQFNYPDGPINLNGGWTVGTVVRDGTHPPANTDDIAILGSAVQIKAGNPQTDNIVQAYLPVNCQPCEDGIITVTFKVKGDPGGDNSTLWGIYFDDPNGVNLARFYTGCNSVRGRTGGLSAGFITVQMNLTGAPTFDECKAVIDTKNNITTYYLNGALMGVSPPTFVNPLSTGVDAANNQNPLPVIGRIMLERQATMAATGVLTIDDIQITSCPGTCSAKVTPTAAQTAYAQSGGGTATPATAVLTIANDNVDSITYTVAKTLSDGVTPDTAGWYSLDKSGGSVAASATDDVTVTFNTTGLSPGVYVGYVTFDDGCAPARKYTRSVKLFVDSCLTDEFGYPDGRLGASPGWRGPAISTQAVYPARVESGALRIVGDPWPTIGGASNSPVFVEDVSSACPSCSVNGGLVSVKIKAKGGAGVDLNIWRLHVRDENGIEFGDWQGQGLQVRGRADVPGANVITDWVPLSTSAYTTLEMRINPDDTRTIGGVPPNATLFLVDGEPIDATGADAPPIFFRNPIPYGTLGTGDAVGRVEVTRVHNPGGAGAFVLLDDLSVSRCTEQCNDPVFDVRDTTNAVAQDGLVTVHDFNVFQNQCATGATPGAGVFDALPFECRCMDVDGDQAVDINDFGRFQRCYTGLAGTVDPSCDD